MSILLLSENNLLLPDKLNILITNSSYIYGGGEFFVLNLARKLKDVCNVYVSCRKDNKLFELCLDTGINVLETPYPEARGNLKTVLNLLGEYIDKYRIDIVHTNDNFDRTAGAYSAQIKNIKSVTNVHVAHSVKHNISHALRNRFLIDHFIADGNTVRDILVNEDMINPEKVTVVFNGINPEEFSADENLRSEFRNKYQISNETVLIGNVARMVGFKGHDLLIRAFAELRSGSGNIKLFIAGDGELESELKNLVSELGIGEKVIFAGFVDDLRSAYSAFDIYAHTSREGGGEAFPFAVLKALAAGLPVTATAVADIPVMVQDSMNGYIVEGENINGIADKLRILADNLSARTEMGRKSIGLLKEKFTDTVMAEKIFAVYDNLMK